jgi:hypothetical protein
MRGSPAPGKVPTLTSCRRCRKIKPQTIRTRAILFDGEAACIEALGAHFMVISIMEPALRPIFGLLYLLRSSPTLWASPLEAGQRNLERGRSGTS